MEKLKRIIYFLIFNTILFSSFSNDHQIRIACVGNSITYGSGLSLPKTECYPGQLVVLLSEKFGDTCIVENFSNPGRTMLKHGDFPLWNEIQFKNALKFVPDICLILLGTNDSKPQNWDVYGNEFLGDYLSMIDTFKFKNPFTKFIVCYPPPAYQVVWDIRNPVILSGVIPAIDSIIKLTNAELVDFYNPLIDSVHLFPDKIHPNAEGSKVMANIVLDKIVESGLIYQVEPGLTFVSCYEANRKNVAVNDTVTLSWKSINASSAELNGESVLINGEKTVVAEKNKTFTLILKGKKNNDTLSIQLNVYDPVISGITIKSNSVGLRNGDSVLLTASYIDQYNYPMKELSSNANWSIVQGEGTLMNNAINPSVFIPGATKRITVKVTVGSYTTETEFIVDPRPQTGVNELKNINDCIVFPNPFSDYINFNFLKTENNPVNIKIYDILGNLLQDNHFFNPSYFSCLKVNATDLSNGLYVYEIDINGHKTKGIIIKK